MVQAFSNFHSKTHTMSFDEFQRIRAKESRWRALKRHLAGIDGDEMVRAVLLLPTNDGRTHRDKDDHDYEERLHEGYKEAKRIHDVGLPLQVELPTKVAAPPPTLECH